LISVPLAQTRRVRFTRPELQKELQKALAVLATTRDNQKKSVNLAFKGEGKRQVRVGYVAESPVWKTSYRLVLAKEKAPFLQGWAIVENTTDEDWTGVKLNLVSGRPISFEMDLYEPLYVKRPEVQLELYASLRPQVYDDRLMERGPAPADEKLFAKRRAMTAASAGGGFDGGMPGAPMAATPLPGPPMPAMRPAEVEAFDPAASVRSAAQSAPVGELFQYEIADPVTLPRQRSALLPIVNQGVEAEKVSIYNGATASEKHPLNGLRLKNTTKLHLMQGPITVFDDGVYAGDAQIQDLPPGGDRLISYAMDLNVEVQPVAKSSPEETVRVTHARGVLYIVKFLRNTTTYTVRNKAEVDRLVIIEHPFQPDWKLTAPKPEPTRSRDRYRIETTAKAGETVRTPVVEERELTQAIQLRSTPDELVGFYLQSTVATDEVRGLLKKLIELRGALTATQAKLKKGETRIAEISTSQDRIRNNMGKVPENSDLFAQYVKKLTDQEAELETLANARHALEMTADEQREALEAFLTSIATGESPESAPKADPPRPETKRATKKR
ncbi:MAG: hypothetical protein ACRC1K_11565, partial [Planctomycetia bacterium]